MKLNRPTMKLTLLPFLIALCFTACADDQQLQEDGVSQETSQEQEEQEQEQEENSADVSDFAEGNATGEEMSNSAAEVIEETAPDQSIMANEFQTEAGAGEGINNAVLNEFAQSEAAAAPATDTGVAEPIEEAAASSASYTPGGRVLYVLPGGTQSFSAKEGGAPMNFLNQGEHPLVFEEGEWARTHDGAFIPKTSLTTSPVGRNKPPSVWQ